MFRPSKKRNIGGIPTASMSDVAFLLLIFFLSTTKFDIKKGLGLVLPAPSTEDTKKVKLNDKNLTKIYVDANGAIAVNEESMPFDQLQSEVRKIVKVNKDMVFSLKVDRKSEYKHMVRALDQLRLAGAEKINLTTN